MNSPARRLLATLASLTSLASQRGFAPSAQADTRSGSLCNDAALSQPFAAWNDNSQYELAPGGDFESPGWTLSNGAKMVSGSEPFAATGTRARFAFVAGRCLAESRRHASTTSTPRCGCSSGDRPGRRPSRLQGLGSRSASCTPAAAGDPSPILRTRTERCSGSTAEPPSHVADTALAGKPVIDDVFIDPWNRT